MDNLKADVPPILLVADGVFGAGGQAAR